MACYYDADIVKADGRRLGDKRQKRPHEKLIMVLYNGMYEAAVDVSKKLEYDHFYNAYSQGIWLTCDLYAIDPSAILSKTAAQEAEGRDEAGPSQQST